jgi:hypothetical protein
MHSFRSSSHAIVFTSILTYIGIPWMIVVHYLFSCFYRRHGGVTVYDTLYSTVLRHFRHFRNRPHDQGRSTGWNSESIMQ